LAENFHSRLKAGVFVGIINVKPSFTGNVLGEKNRNLLFSQYLATNTSWLSHLAELPQKTHHSCSLLMDKEKFNTNLIM